MMYGFGIGFSPSNRLFSGGGGGNPLWNGLQAYYTADSTPNDALGNYNGTLVNGATYGTGIINQGFSLDGVNDYVDIGNNLDFSGDTPFSFSCWINPLGSTTVNILSKFNSLGSFPGYTLHLKSNLVRFIIQNNNATDRIRVATTSTLTSGLRHISLTYDGSTNASGVKIYVDGVNQSVNADIDTFTGGLTTTSEFVLGGFVTGFNYFDGIIDEVGVWNKELTQSEVTELYNSGAGKQY